MSSIMVGIDGSSASRSALLWAAKRAQRLDLPLRLVHVVDDEWGAPSNELVIRERELADGIGIVEREFPGTVPTGQIVVGNPAVELVTLARTSALLVLGTHKTGFVQGRVFGSRALRLAAESEVPVAVIPEHATGERSGVVVGFDSSTASEAAIAFGVRESGLLGDDLLLILATGASPGSSVERHGPVGRELDLTSRALRIAEEAGADVPVRVRTLRREPASALIDVAGRAKLLVIGSSRRHVDGRAALGPVAHDVLVNLTTPTVVVHPR